MKNLIFIASMIALVACKNNSAATEEPVAVDSVAAVVDTAAANVAVADTAKAK